MDDTAVLAQAVAAVWPDLPALIGPDFPEFSSVILGLLRLMETEGADQDAAGDELLGQFARYPDARAELIETFARLMPQTTRGADRRPTARGARYVVLPVYYGTDRTPTGITQPNDFYGAGRGPLSLGVVEVAIPDDHRKGRLEKPSIWRLQFSENPDKHVMLMGLDVLDKQHFAAGARRELGQTNPSHALIFVHGYNVAFKDAARRAGQLAADLNFDGLPMLYSWPSEAATGKYAVDETNVDWSRPHFREFIDVALNELGVQTVSIVAHSMGNRVVAETLAALNLTEPRDGAARLRHVVFAAPDIDKDTFRHLVTAFDGRADRFTLYASSGDLALKASKQFHKYPRAGDVRPEMLVIDRLDSVDATLVDTSFLGHSYFGDNRSVVSDLFQLIRHDHGPADRGLTARPQGHGTYWAFT